MLVVLCSVFVQLLLRVHIDAADHRSIIDKELLTIGGVHVTVEIVGGCLALFVLLDKHISMILSSFLVLFCLNLGFFGLKFVFSLDLLLLGAWWFFVHNGLMSVMWHSSVVSMVALVLSERFRGVESALGELFGRDLAGGASLEVSISSLVSSHDGVAVMNWLSLLVMSLLSAVMWTLKMLLVGLMVLLGVLHWLARFVVGSRLAVLPLKVVVLLDFVLSECLDPGGVPLLGLAKLLVIFLLGGNCFPASNVVSLVVQGLLLGQGVEPVVHGVVRDSSAAVVMDLIQRGMSLSWCSSVSKIVSRVTSSSQVSHLLLVTLATMRPHRLRSASLVLFSIVMGTVVTLLVSLWISSLLVMVGWCTSSHLTMESWLPHLPVLRLLHLAWVVSDPVHSAESLLLSWVNWSHSALHLSSLLSLHGLLLCLDVLLSLFLSLVEHVADFAEMVDLGVAGVELVVFISTLNHLVPSLLLGHLTRLVLFALIPKFLGLFRRWCFVSRYLVS